MFPRVYGMVWYRLITRQVKICVVSVWIDYSFGAELTVLRRHTCQTNFPHFTLAEKLCIVSLVYNITSWMRSHNFGIKFLASWIFYRFPFMILVLGLHYLKDAFCFCKPHTGTSDFCHKIVSFLYTSDIGYSDYLWTYLDSSHNSQSNTSNIRRKSFQYLSQGNSHNIRYPLYCMYCVSTSCVYQSYSI